MACHCPVGKKESERVTGPGWSSTWPIAVLWGPENLGGFLGHKSLENCLVGEEDGL